MINKLAVGKIDPQLVQHVREVYKGKVKAKHPVYDVKEHKGTGKATCRGCGEKIKEGDPALLFWNARYDEGHDLSFIRDRSIIHAEGCTEGPLVRCPHCAVQVADGTLSAHVEENHQDRFKWQLRNRAASVVKLCFLHKKAHCGQCEQDRILEIPKFREEVLNILGIEVTSSEDWRHTEEDGFEMWETTEKHNEFAIVENDDSYDLYELTGSFNSVEEAKEAAGTTKTAQDGGGGGGASSGGSGGGDGGSSGGGDSGASTGGEGGDSGDSGFSSGTSDSDSDDSYADDGDEDPRPPSEHNGCPRCGHDLNPIYLAGGRIFTCMNCGFTSRKKKKREINSSWFDRIPKPQADSRNQDETTALPIDPVLPPMFYEDNQATQNSPGDAGDLFSMN